ncbi:MAG: hypothetical protein FWH26_10510 [Oscillospiraceae bacterium]|nr:hypothetical protein [Oscillospiraceae bacterium]
MRHSQFIVHKYRFGLVLLLLPALLFFGGCKPKPPPPMPAAFSARAKVRYGEAAMEAALSQEAPGCLRAEFTAPPELRGMRLSLDGERASLSYGGLAAEWEAGHLPSAGFVPLLNRALLQLAQPQAEAEPVKGGGWIVRATADGIGYAATLDAQGLLSRFEAPGIGLVVEVFPLE